MKITKKKVFVSALIVCLLAIISMSTLAWFSASDSVKNEFYVADSDNPNPDELFAVEVWEKTPESAEDTDGYTYEKVLPGAKLVKEAHVENTGYHGQYVRVTVTVSNAAAWTAMLGDDIKMGDLFVDFNEADWNHISRVIDTDPAVNTITYVLYYSGILESGKDVTVFSHVQIPEAMTVAQAEAFDGGFTVDLFAEAVQTEHVVPEGTPAEDAAFEAFKTVFPNP